MEINVGEVILIVLGLSQWIKTKAGLVDKTAEYLSLAVGFIVGGLYQYSVTMPVDAKMWFEVLIVAIGMALVPSGLYKFAGAYVDRFSANKTKE